MSLSCFCGFDEFDWYWELHQNEGFKPLPTKRSRRCCSCKKKIVPGDECVEVPRWRPPKYEPPYIEERIHGDQVWLAPWWLCEACGGLMFALDERKFCFTLGGESLQEQILEYNEAMGVQRIQRSA